MKHKPYRKNSIQYYFFNLIIDNYEIIIDDDDKGEIADLIGINEHDDVIEVTLYHLKYAAEGKTTGRIDNFYEVCGQAQKSLKWKYRENRSFFDHIFRRDQKRIKAKKSSRVIKGNHDRLETIAQAAKWEKEIQFKICIVQPGLKKGTATNDILQLLGNTKHYLKTVGNVELYIYTS